MQQWQISVERLEELSYSSSHPQRSKWITCRLMESLCFLKGCTTFTDIVILQLLNEDAGTYWPCRHKFIKICSFDHTSQIWKSRFELACWAVIYNWLSDRRQYFMTMISALLFSAQNTFLLGICTFHYSFLKPNQQVSSCIIEQKQSIKAHWPPWETCRLVQHVTDTQVSSYYREEGCERLWEISFLSVYLSWDQQDNTVLHSKCWQY